VAKKQHRIWTTGGPGFSSKTDLWATPRHVFAALDCEFQFELDVCASPTNAKCGRFFTAAEDGLAQEWTGSCWMNPPYGRGIGDWMEKAADSAVAGAVVVALVPARTDTVWWHEQVMGRASEVRLIRGRLAFGDGRAPAPFPSAVVVYRPGRAQLEVVAWTPPCPERVKAGAATPMKQELRTKVGACRGSADNATTDHGSLRP
jgi:phage N-6-adenine-methyltransferase